MNPQTDSEILVLQEISSVLVRERHVHTLFQEVLAILERRMGMVRGTVTLLDGDEVTIEVSRGLAPGERSLGRYHLGEGITGQVAQTGKAQLIPDIRHDKRFLNRTGARGDETRPLAFVCVPLVHLGQVIGTLSADCPNPDAPSTSSALERDVALLGIIANMTADAAGICLKEREEREALEEENRKLRTLLKEESGPGTLIGNCREMRAVYEQIRQVAPSEATVLIRGASGTGKELVARAIQSLSRRKDRPFVVLNCAALPENLVESELFGHEKGAFTGAVGRRAGRAEAADGGTLFLDEIGDLSVPVQVKLLRFLQERTFSRIGSNEEIRSNVRFIAATSRNLEDLMARNLFREDLYYRLSVFPITMPDLAHRAGDIPLLAEHFIGKMNRKYGKTVRRLSAPALRMLLAYPWPGNVRELENCIERAVLTARDDTIRGYNLPPALRTEELEETPYAPEPEPTPAPSPASPPPLPLPLPEVPRNAGNGAAPPSLAAQLRSCEKQILEAALLRHHNNRSAAGRELGVSARMMNYRLKKLGLLPTKQKM